MGEQKKYLVIGAKNSERFENELNSADALGYTPIYFKITEPNTMSDGYYEAVVKLETVKSKTGQVALQV